MAVRKLAPPELQPESFAFTPENEAWAEREIAKYPPDRQASAVIALLWRAQEQNGGWLPQKAIEAVAVRLDMAPIRVMEVATFYTMFNLDPVGKHLIQLCGTTPCALRGAGFVKEILERRVGPERHVSADGLFSWLEVECLGACANAPMVQINDQYYEDLTRENFEQLLNDLAAGRPVRSGSQIGRRSSEPHNAVNTLTDPSLYDGSVIGAWRKRFEEAAKAADAEAAAKAPGAPAEAKEPTPAPAATKPAAAPDKAAQDETTGGTAAARKPRAQGKRAGATETATMPEQARAAKPLAGRAIESPAADTPAERAKQGEPPIEPSDRAAAGAKNRATAVKPRKEKAAVKAPQSSKSYVGTPSKPGEGRPVASQPTTPVAGTPPSEARGRRDGSESKPDVVVDDDDKSS